MLLLRHTGNERKTTRTLQVLTKDYGACWWCCYAGLPRDPCLNCRYWRGSIGSGSWLVVERILGTFQSIRYVIHSVHKDPWHFLCFMITQVVILCHILFKLERRLHGKSGRHMMNSLQQPSASCTMHLSKIKWLKRRKLLLSTSPSSFMTWE